MISHGTYIGRDRQHLNKTAMLMLDPENDDNYLCQFDQLWLPTSHGWHSFPKADFFNLSIELTKDNGNGKAS